MQMAGSAEVSIVIWSQYISLKLFLRTLENDVIKWPLFHTFRQAFYKSFVILVFWNKYSANCTDFYNDWLKTWPNIRNFVFILKDSHREKVTPN